MNLRKDHYRRSGKWTLNKPCSLSPGGRPPGPFPVFSLSCRTGIPPPSLLPASGASRGVFFRRSPLVFFAGSPEGGALKTQNPAKPHSLCDAGREASRRALRELETKRHPQTTPNSESELKRRRAASCAEAFSTFNVVKLSATDVLAPTTMKNAAKCDTSCDLQNPVNHQNFERTLRFRDMPGSMLVGVSVDTSRPPPRLSLLPKREARGWWRTLRVPERELRVHRTS